MKTTKPPTHFERAMRRIYEQAGEPLPESIGHRRAPKERSMHMRVWDWRKRYESAGYTVAAVQPWGTNPATGEPWSVAINPRARTVFINFHADDRIILNVIHRIHREWVAKGFNPFAPYTPKPAPQKPEPVDDDDADPADWWKPPELRTKKPSNWREDERWWTRGDRPDWEADDE